VAQSTSPNASSPPRRAALPGRSTVIEPTVLDLHQTLTSTFGSSTQRSFLRLRSPSSSSMFKVISRLFLNHRTLVATTAHRRFREPSLPRGSFCSYGAEACLSQSPQPLGLTLLRKAASLFHAFMEFSHRRFPFEIGEKVPGQRALAVQSTNRYPYRHSYFA